MFKEHAARTLALVTASDVEVKSSPTAKGTAVTYYGISKVDVIIGYEGAEWFIPVDQVAPK